MASYTKKAKAVAEAESEIEVTSEVEEQAEVPAPKEVKKVAKKFEQSDGVMVRSVTNGLLNVIGQKTGILYRWSDYGDVTEMEYRDLVAEVRSRAKSVMEPRVIIEDKDFIAEFKQMQDFYAKEYNTKNLMDILQLTPEKMRAAILDLPQTVLPNFRSIVATQIQDGRLDSVKKIKILDEVLGTDLNFLAELLQ